MSCALLRWTARKKSFGRWSIAWSWEFHSTSPDQIAIPRNLIILKISKTYFSINIIAIHFPMDWHVSFDKHTYFDGFSTRTWPDFARIQDNRSIYIDRVCPGQSGHATLTHPPGQNGRHFADDIFRCIFVNEKFCILIWISLKFVPKGPIDNIPALDQIMAWRRPGDKPLSEPMLFRLLTHVCVTRPQWVKT